MESASALTVMASVLAVGALILSMVGFGDPLQTGQEDTVDEGKVFDSMRGTAVRRPPARSLLEIQQEIIEALQEDRISIATVAAGIAGMALGFTGTGTGFTILVIAGGIAAGAGAISSLWWKIKRWRLRREKKKLGS